MSLDWQVSKEHSKKHDFSAAGQAVLVDVRSEPSAAASFELRQLAHESASEGKLLQKQP